MTMKRFHACLALTLALMAATLGAQQFPTLEKGFAPDKVFQFGELDAINTFNGNLTFQIPLGPSYPVNAVLSYSLGLHYNSKAWDPEQISFDTGVRMVPNRRSNAGMGWLVSLGRLYGPDSPSSTSIYWIYESPDGQEHRFDTKIHPSDNFAGFSAPVTAVAYTRDGTYIRMLRKNDGTIDLEFPDGTIRTFNASSGNLTSIHDRFGNAIAISYLPSIAGTPCPFPGSFAWRITDSRQARTNYVCFTRIFSSPESEYEGVVDRVILAAPNSSAGSPRTAVYAFNYSIPSPNLPRPCPSTPGSGPVPLLDALVQPDGTQFTFHYNLTNHEICDVGTLSSAVLPTGGTLSYTYREYTIPAETCDNRSVPWESRVIGVGTKTISGPGLTTGTWTYDSRLSASQGTVSCQQGNVNVPKPAPSEELTVTVTSPAGDVTENFYSVWPTFDYTAPHGFTINEYGLPFTRTPGTSSGGRQLSQRVYSAAGYAATPRTPLRSTYVTYERDGICTGLDPGCLDVEKRVPQQRVVYHDDGGAFTDTVSSDFDGLGHYRNTSLSGTAGSGGVDTFAGYNRRDSAINPDDGIDSGTYPASFVLPPITNPESRTNAWILDHPSRISRTENGVTATTEACYDGATGFLRAVRTLRGAARATSDLLTVYKPEMAGVFMTGHVEAEKYSGGDPTTSATGIGQGNDVPTATPLCGIADASPAASYQLTHTYDTWGNLATSAYAGKNFNLHNYSYDPPTGLATHASGPDGLVTELEYDTSFRLTRLKPPGMAATTYSYSPAIAGTTFTPARVEAKQLSTQFNPNTFFTTLGAVEKHYQYDLMGRLFREKTRMPDNSWSVQETKYDPAGRVSSASVAETLVIPEASPQNPSPTEFDFAPAHRTTFGGYDPFGRATVVTAPDGKVTSTQYTGARSVTRTRSMATGQTETGVSTVDSYDLQGRLTSVTEGAGSDDALTTSYAYDVGGRLASVSIPGPIGPQLRTFTYDRAGLLQQERHPELGVNGNGVAAYTDYDARGHAHRKTVGSIDLRFTFDAAERLETVTDGAATRLLKLFAYDVGYACPAMSTICQGKLVAAARYNYFDSFDPVVVSESYQYDSANGSISRKDQTAGSSSWSRSFHVAQSLNDLGSTSAIDYPCRSAENGDCETSDRPARAVHHGYTNGPLTSVGTWAPAITYQPNGAIASVTHGSGNGVREVWTPDPSGMARPAAIAAKNGSDATLWTTGAYGYDGAGNIKQIDRTTYSYDQFERLHEWTVTSADDSFVTNTVKFDPFGNYLSTGVRSCSSPAAAVQRCFSSSAQEYAVAGTTNHYQAYSYDAAGNVISDGPGRSYSYDPIGMTSTFVFNPAGSAAKNLRYVYAPDDERMALIERINGQNAHDRITWTLRGFGNELRSVWTDDSTSNPQFQWREDEIYRGSLLLANESPAGTKHYTLDHLGSPRAITGTSGQLLGTQDFTPFGRGGTSGAGMLQFTGHERDAVTTGMSEFNSADYMHARSYSATTGRFLSPDRLLGNLLTPRSWNRYAYVLNDPINRVDPTGLCEQKLSESLCTDMTITVEATAQTPTEQKVDAALDIASDTLDWTLRDAIDKIGAGRVITGLYNDNPTEVAKGVGQQFLWVAPGAAAAGSEALGAAASTLMATPEVGVTTILDTSRVLERAAEVGAQDLGHNFPAAFDAILVRSGQYEIKSADYIQYSIRGFLQTSAGEYQLGGKLINGILYVTHRGFVRF
jgi:RHS repeat-associated protein